MAINKTINDMNTKAQKRVIYLWGAIIIALAMIAIFAGFAWVGEAVGRAVDHQLDEYDRYYITIP